MNYDNPILNEIANNPDFYAQSDRDLLGLARQDVDPSYEYGGFSTYETLRAHGNVRHMRLFYYALQRLQQVHKAPLSVVLHYVSHLHPQYVFELAKLQYQWNGSEDSWGEARADFHTWVNCWGRQSFAQYFRNEFDLDPAAIQWEEIATCYTDEELS